MGLRVLLVRHEHADDRVVTGLTQAGFEIDSRQPFAGELLGEPGDDLGGTVVFGGSGCPDTDDHVKDGT